MCVLTEPTNPLRSQARSVEVKDRRITIAAAIEDIDHHGLVGEVSLGLTVQYVKDRRVHVAALTRSIRQQRGPSISATTARSTSRDEQVNTLQLFERPAGRFSASMLEVATDDALAAVDQLLGCGALDGIMRDYDHVTEPRLTR